VQTWMLVTAALIVALPFVLLFAFNRGNTADSRGRRVSARWRRQRTRA
jgi:hypothetical protein